ncbi:MAG: amidohydrolase family protein, partial [Promethearchaeota archaeon]
INLCHISCIEIYSLIAKAINQNSNLKITFEITPHHLLLSNKINLKNVNFGKVLPPLRDKPHPQFLYNKLKEGKIQYIATDHAPHTLKEKSNKYIQSPSGFPGFETYPLMLLNSVCHYELDLATFVKISSENPAILFNLKKKGFIKIGYAADLIIIDKISEYSINPENFKTKAKFSPFEGFKTSVQIWKVIVGGYEINYNNSKPSGKIIKRSI